MAQTVYEALVARFTEAGLDAVFTNGLVRGAQLPGSHFPYALLADLTDAVTMRTRQSVYRAPGLQVTIYDRTPDDVEAHIPAVLAALEDAPLPTEPGSPQARYCRPGAVRRSPEDVFYKAVIELQVVTAAARGV